MKKICWLDAVIIIGAFITLALFWSLWRFAHPWFWPIMYVLAGGLVATLMGINRRVLEAWGSRWAGIFLLLMVMVACYGLYSFRDLVLHWEHWRYLAISMAILSWMIGFGIEWGLGIWADKWVGITALILFRHACRPAIPRLLHLAWQVKEVYTMLRDPVVRVVSSTSRAFTLDDLLNDGPSMRALSKREFRAILGHDGEGHPVRVDLDKLYNVAVFGPIRSGKSHLIRGVVASLLAKPGIMEVLDFTIIDLKGDLSSLAPLGDYIMNPSDAVDYLTELAKEMEAINRLRIQHDVDWWHQLPKAVAPKPRLIILDESQQTFDQGGRHFTQAFAYFTNTCAANGVVIIATGLYPRNDLFPRKCLANFHGKATFKTTEPQSLINLFGPGLSKKYRKRLAEMEPVGEVAFHDGSSAGLRFVSAYEVSRKRLGELVTNALVEACDEYHLLFMAVRAKVGGAQAISDLMRSRLETKYPGVSFDWLHKRWVMDALWHLVRAGILIYRGERRPYEIHGDAHNFGAFVSMWEDYIAGGGIDRPLERGEERLPFVDMDTRGDPHVGTIRRDTSRIEESLMAAGFVAEEN